MLRSLVVPLAYLIQWKLGACQGTYWVDSSCAGKIPGMMGDALRMAAGASIRLNDPHDQNQHEAFTRVFKAQLNDVNTIAEVHR